MMCKGPDACAFTRRAAVMINFVVHVICAKLELQVLKVGRFSIGWFMSAARRVRAQMESFAHHGVKHNDFFAVLKA